jgi:hypothetical protein
MAEVVGLTLSIITLIDTCITTCNLISKARAFPSDLELLHTGLLWEAARLREWAKSWAIEPNSSTTDRLSADRGSLLIQEAGSASVDLVLVERILKNAEQLLSRGEKIIVKYDEPPSSKVNALSKGIRATVSRATWSVVDHETIRTLVGDLETQNNRLNCVRPRSIAQSADVHLLATTSGALASIDRIGVKPTEIDTAYHPELTEMLSMRAQQDRAENSELGGSDSSMYVPQAENKVVYDQGTTSPARTLGEYCSGPSADNMHVLIEWKYYMGSDSSSRQLAFSRAERIAQRLAGSGKPAGFRILACVGWFVERSNQRCGIMFALTPYYTTVCQNPKLRVGVVTLADIIRAKTRPTLNDRFRLAFLLSTSLLKLHMARWMHKNISADNIVFFSIWELGNGTPFDAVDITKPYLASFGLARPDHSFESSEAAVSSTPISRAYQHPSYSKAVVHDTQDGAPTVRIPRYHKEYDIYSLGCVLFEIGMWRPLKDLGWRDRYNDDLNSWRLKLQQKVRENVSFSVGQIYEDVVMSCLEADVEDPFWDGELPVVSSSTEAYCWDIVRKLDQLRV